MTEVTWSIVKFYEVTKRMEAGIAVPAGLVVKSTNYYTEGTQPQVGDVVQGRSPWGPGYTVIAVREVPVVPAKPTPCACCEHGRMTEDSGMGWACCDACGAI